MRRADREITIFDEKVAILSRCAVARLGFWDGAEPYIVPLSFGMEASGGRLTLYFHCAADGRKLAALAQNPRVCFEADRLIETVGGGEACEWTARYESVIGWGTLRKIDDPSEKRAALDAIMRHNGFAGTPSYKEGALIRTTALRLDVDSFTAKLNA